MVYADKITEPAAWTAADLEADRSWEVELSPPQVADLEDALAGETPSLIMCTMTCGRTVE